MSSPYIMTLAFYNDKVMSGTTELMAATKYSVTSKDYEKYKFGFEGYLINNKIYGAAASQFFANALLGISHYGYYTDMNVALTYADTSKLYL